MKKTTLAILTSLASTAFADGVDTQVFTFDHNGSVMSGTLYLPEGHDGIPLPTVVVTGAWTTVQQQMPSLYAHEMVERGFAAVTFDFRGWGKSGNLPADTAGGMRYIEMPSAKIADINAAVDHIAGFDAIDGDQIVGLGICASAGYMVDAAILNDNLKAVGLVAPWLQNQEIVNAVYGGADGVNGLINMALQADLAGGQLIHAGYTSDSLMGSMDYYSNFDRGLVPAYDNKWNHASWNDWLTYFPADRASALNTPVAIVHSEAAAIPDGVRTFAAQTRSASAVTWLDDVTQEDFYDNAEDVNTASDLIAEHFRTVL